MKKMEKLFNFIPIIVLLLANFTIITTIGAVLDSEVIESKLESGIEDLDGRINHLANKTTKILVGQTKPSVPVSQTQQMQNVYQHNQMQNQQQQQQMQNVYQQQGYNPNYPNSPNYPVSPGDLSGQGSGPKPNYQQQQPQAIQQQTPEGKPPAGIPEIYLQIVGAIEKLVGRMDKLETRLQTVENIVYHMTSTKKDEPQKGSCPDNYVKIDGIRGKCYHVSSFDKTPNVFDWKSAHAECGKIGGRLVEMVHYDDFLRISQFLVKYGKSKDSPAGSSDYWIGGINPGLIWIWTESGQQVGMDRRFWNENDNSSNAPGCLKLSYSHRLDAFFFKGAPCSHSQNILCEVMDNTVSRALAKFEHTLWAENSLSYNTTDDD